VRDLTHDGRLLVAQYRHHLAPCPANAPHPHVRRRLMRLRSAFRALRLEGSRAADDWAPDVYYSYNTKRRKRDLHPARHRVNDVITESDREESVCKDSRVWRTVVVVVIMQCRHTQCIQIFVAKMSLHKIKRPQICRMFSESAYAGHKPSPQMR
jgi:hypothetical protein